MSTIPTIDPSLHHPGAPSPSAWSPPLGVVAHNGEPMPPDREFFAAPSPEIGEVNSAWSTLTFGKSPKPIALRAGIAFALLCAGFFGVSLGADSAGWKAGHPDVGIMAVGAGIGLVAALIAYFSMRFSHTCSFTGTDGIVKYAISGSRDAVPKPELLLFDTVTDLRTSQTRNYHNGIYTGTSYTYTWKRPDGSTALRLNGTYSSKEGTPKIKDAYWFARAGEVAWNSYQLDLINEDLEKMGYVEFPINKTDAVRVGRGFLEFVWKGEIARINVDEVRDIRLNSGQFQIAHKDAKWFSSKGKFSFAYGNMSNAQLFLASLDSLLGYRFE
jgi:hypothetical protein